MTAGLRPESMEGPPITPEPSYGAPDREGRPSAGGPALRRRWAGRPGVAGRLLIAVLLPITILAIAAGALLRDRYNTAQQANSVANDIPTLNGLVKLRSVLDQERIPVEATLRTAQFGINLPNVASFYGFQNETEPTARAALYGSCAPSGAPRPRLLAEAGRTAAHDRRRPRRRDGCRPRVRGAVRPRVRRVRRSGWPCSSSAPPTSVRRPG